MSRSGLLSRSDLDAFSQSTGSSRESSERDAAVIRAASVVIDRMGDKAAESNDAAILDAATKIMKKRRRGMSIIGRGGMASSAAGVGASVGAGVGAGSAKGDHGTTTAIEPTFPNNSMSSTLAREVHHAHMHGTNDYAEDQAKSYIGSSQKRANRIAGRGEKAQAVEEAPFQTAFLTQSRILWDSIAPANFSENRHYQSHHQAFAALQNTLTSTPFRTWLKSLCGLCVQKIALRHWAQRICDQKVLRSLCRLRRQGFAPQDSLGNDEERRRR